MVFLFWPFSARICLISYLQHMKSISSLYLVRVFLCFDLKRVFDVIESLEVFSVGSTVEKWSAGFTKKL